MQRASSSSKFVVIRRSYATSPKFVQGQDFKFTKALKKDPTKQASLISGLLEGAEKIDFATLDPKSMQYPIFNTAFPEKQTRAQNEALQNGTITHDQIEAEDEQRLEQVKAKLQDIQAKQQPFQPSTTEEQHWFDIYNGTDIAQQKQQFTKMLSWLFGLSAEKRRAFVKWLQNDKQKLDYVKRIKTAFMQMKLYSANANIEVHREMSKDQAFYDDIHLNKKPAASGFEYGKMKRIVENAEHDVMYPNFLNEYEVASDIKASQSNAISSNDAAPAKRFRGSMIGAGDVNKFFTSEQFQAANPSIDTSDVVFTTDSYFQAKSDPFNYGLFERASLNDASEHLKRFVARMANTDSMFGASDYKLDSLAKNFGIDGKNPTEDSAEIDLVSKSINHAMTNYRDDPDFKFAMAFAPYSFHPTKDFDEIVLKQSRTNIQKKSGRVESYNAMTVIGNPDGFVGFGFGESSTAGSAYANARRNAFTNLRAFPVPHHGKPLVSEMKGRFHRSLVIINYNKQEGVRGHNVLRRICEWIGLQHITIKTHGSRNYINLIPAFLDALSHLRNVEQVALGRGLMPTFVSADISNYMNRVHANRGVYGWN